MPKPADTRFAELAARYDAVAQAELPSGVTSFVCRSHGAIVHAELVDKHGEILDDDTALKLLSGHRKNLATAREQMTDHAFAHAALRMERGEEVNLTELARALGVARQTVYSRLECLTAEPAPSDDDDETPGTTVATRAAA